MKLFTRILVALFTLAVASSTLADSLPAQYGKWITYSKNTALQFPDFKLNFLGKTMGRPFPGTSRPMGNVFHFEIGNVNEQTQVKWSSGTGDIAPSSFVMGGKEFILEMLSSSALETRMRKDDQIIVWPKSQWLAQTEKLRTERNEKLK